MNDNVVKYLYVDDSDNAKSFISALNLCKKLNIQFEKPTEKRLHLINQIVSDSYDGLIIDQQLYEKKIVNNDKEYNADYTGSSLSFDVRSEQKLKTISGETDYSIPIVLYSAGQNVPDIINSAGRELFDYVIYKGSQNFSEFSNNIPLYQQILFSLGRGYKTLKETKEVKMIFALDDLSDLDSRFIESFCIYQKDMVSVQARFIINELIIKQGILIDEDILAVRLGIDKKSEGWDKVKESLRGFNAEYKGVFHEGWSRWWMPIVEKWWYKQIDEDEYIGSYSSANRAKLISEKLNIKLDRVTTSSKFSVHENYWTICDFTKEPLDIEDGLLLPEQNNLFPWQDAKYVSIEAAINNDVQVSDSDKKKLTYYKDLLTPKR